ncbi:hypothetical protein KIN20_033584 [Parelaphostrongylus tenuis]|uniref:Uncharacterized protein n=1 Tax=Parelaphostrongylus tenuis TaxID=148309 RepID=A0AAD5WIX0_PARTN|nr:hypothetical protein KIN20_033584 [Parelaphostrongylus tenuis]
MAAHANSISQYVEHQQLLVLLINPFGTACFSPVYVDSFLRDKKIGDWIQYIMNETMDVSTWMTLLLRIVQSKRHSAVVIRTKDFVASKKLSSPLLKRSTSTSSDMSADSPMSSMPVSPFVEKLPTTHSSEGINASRVMMQQRSLPEQSSFLDNPTSDDDSLQRDSCHHQEVGEITKSSDATPMLDEMSCTRCQQQIYSANASTRFVLFRAIRVDYPPLFVFVEVLRLGLIRMENLAWRALFMQIEFMIKLWPEEDDMSRAIRNGWTTSAPSTYVPRSQSSNMSSEHGKVDGQINESHSMHNQLRSISSPHKSPTYSQLDEAER